MAASSVSEKQLTSNPRSLAIGKNTGAVGSMLVAQNTGRDDALSLNEAENIRSYACSVQLVKDIEHDQHGGMTKGRRIAEEKAK